MLIEKANTKKNVMQGITILLTGGAGGIGYETARVFSFLGANVIIADIDKDKGLFAEKSINLETSSNRVLFYQIDISNENEIEKLYAFIVKNYKFVDVIFNNATVTPVGAVDKTLIADWDKSYMVNLKAPVLLAQKFLPLMKAKKRGTLVFVSSSGASPFLGAYEVLKTAQVELCNTLTYELENTGIYTYTISPGLVKTESAKKAIDIVSKNMRITTEDFYKSNANFILDTESAGVGFALSILKALEYNGQEIGAIQVLTDFGINNSQNFSEKKIKIDMTKKECFLKIYKTFSEQYSGWQKMNIFQRQWVLRDFKKTRGQSADQTYEELKIINFKIEKENSETLYVGIEFFDKLKNYWKRQLKLLQGFEKNKEKLAEHTKIILGWIKDIEIFTA